MLMSALVPGSGQMYVDGAPHGIWFMVVEAAALASGLLLRESGVQARDDAAAYAGTPQDTSANWSFARWISATGNDPGTLQALYDQDREVFFDLIGSEQELLPGWSGNAETTRAGFVDLRATSDRRLHGARWSESLLWVNHMVAAFDAVRVARLHNRALGLGLEWKGSWRHGAPAFSATLKRRF
jgi:hypothetical protein